MGGFWPSIFDQEPDLSAAARSVVPSETRTGDKYVDNLGTRRRK